jgi:hypothetical protein
VQAGPQLTPLAAWACAARCTAHVGQGLDHRQWAALPTACHCALTAGSRQHAQGRSMSALSTHDACQQCSTVGCACTTSCCLPTQALAACGGTENTSDNMSLLRPAPGSWVGCRLTRYACLATQASTHYTSRSSCLLMKSGLLPAQACANSSVSATVRTGRWRSCCACAQQQTIG